MSTLISLAGTGGFQDASGQPIAFGTMTAQLQTDEGFGTIQACAGRIVTFSLDANGNVVSGSLWGPAVYLFTAYTAQGLKVWSMLVSLTVPPS